MTQSKIRSRDNLSDEIPAELKTRAQWVAWKYEDHGKPKRDKVPYTPRTGQRAKTNDPTTWGTFAEALTAYQLGYDGIGFVFTPDDPYAGIDLDSCRDPRTVSLEPWAATIVKALNSYTEVSPSGTGVHIIVKATLPAEGRKKGQVEIYEASRFFTMTGHQLRETPTIIEDRQEALTDLHTRIFGAKEHARQVTGSNPSPSVAYDEEILTRAKRAKNGDLFTRLFAGDWTGYPSQSEADQALCNLLTFYCGPDPARINRLFQQSGLYRQKWDDKHFSSGKTYGEATIEKALAGAQEFYKGKGNGLDTANTETQQQPADLAPPLSQSNSFALIPLKALLEEPEEAVSWLVEKTLPTGGFSLLVAKPKAGKSTLARNLALAVAQGRDFFNRTVQQGPVIYLALEEKRSEVRQHFKDMGATGEEEIYIFAAAAPADALQQIRAEVEAKKPVLLIIDPLFRFTRIKDGNDYAQVTQALEPLLVLARETGTHVLCIHHAGKSEREGGDNILGSTAIFAAVDTALIMKRSERYRTIASQQRYGEDLPETVLHFDQQARTLTLGESKEVEEGNRIAEAILTCLKAQEDDQEKGHALTQVEIEEEVEGKTAYKRKALKSLVDGKQVARHGKGGRGSPYLYCLKDSRFLVPSLYEKQGNKKQKSDLTLQKDSPFSCSRDSDLFADSGKSQEQEKSALTDPDNSQDFNWATGEQETWEDDL